MENNKEIGKLFKEQLDALDISPKDGGWDAIQTELNEKKKKRRFFIPFWFGAIGLLSIGIYSWFLLLENSSSRNIDFLNKKIEQNSSNSKNNESNKDIIEKLVVIDSSKNQLHIDKVYDALKKQIETKKALNSSFAKKSSTESEKNLQNSNKKNTFLNLNSKNKIANNQFYSKNNLNKNSKKDNNIKKIVLNFEKQNQVVSIESISENKSVSNTPNQLSNNKNSFQLNDTIKSESTSIKKIDSIASKKLKKQQVKSQEKDSLQTEENKKGKFAVFAFASPTLSVFNSKTSLLDNRLDNNSKNTEIGLSYGVFICFEGTERFSLRIGVAKSNLKFVTNNALLNTYNYSEINYASGISNAFIYVNSNNSATMKITQEIGYIEVPLEAKYKIIDKKISLNGILGFSYLFLDKNEIYIETSNGTKYNIGQTRDLLKQTISINLGLGLNYKITKRLKFNLEPIVKYNLKSSQNINYSNLFSINVLSGFQYSFGK